MVDPMASYWVVEIVDPMASPWMVEVAMAGTTGSAASYRVFAASWETILRHRERNPSNEQRRGDRNAF